MAEMLKAGKVVLNITLFQAPPTPSSLPPSKWTAAKPPAARAPRMPTLLPPQGGARPSALITPYLLFRRALCCPATPTGPGPRQPRPG